MTDTTGFEPNEIWAAKNIAYNSIARALERAGVDAEEEDNPINLTVVADDVIEALLDAGVTIPEQIVDPNTGLPAQDLPITETGYTDAQTLVILRLGARALQGAGGDFNEAVAGWLLGEALTFAGIGPYSELSSLKFESAGHGVGILRIARKPDGDLTLSSSTIGAAIRVALLAIEEAPVSGSSE